MKATLVSDLLTPCTALQFARAIRGGLETLVGQPSDAHVAVLTAQSALESGRWRSMHRNNPGNIKAGPDYEYLYCQFRCNEVIAGKVQWFEPPHPQTNFRAYMDLETGVIDYLRFLSSRARYAGAWRAAQSGDPSTFVHALKQGNYFTADEAPYLRAVVSLFGEYMRLLAQPDRDTEPPPNDAEHAAALLTVAPDPERLLHTEAVLLAAQSLERVLDDVRDDRNEQLKED